LPVVAVLQIKRSPKRRAYIPLKFWESALIWLHISSVKYLYDSLKKLLIQLFGIAADHSVKVKVRTQ